MNTLRGSASLAPGKLPAALLIGLMGFLPGPVRATMVTTVACPCTLAWEASSDGAPAGYAVYYGLAGSSTTNRLDVGAVQTATIYNLTVSSNYFFYVAAYNVAHIESNPSPAIFYRPSALSNLRLATQADGTLNLQFRTAPGAVGSIQYTPSLLNPQWQTLGNSTADANGMITIIDPLPNHPPARYYRAVR